MKIDFDLAKDIRNRKERGVSLAAGQVVLLNRVGEKAAADLYGERRRIAYGLVEGRLFVCVYTMRGDTHWIISVRPASRQERKRWWR